MGFINWEYIHKINKHRIDWLQQSIKEPFFRFYSVTKTSPENRSQQYLIRIELTLR